MLLYSLYTRNWIPLVNPFDIFKIWISFAPRIRRIFRIFDSEGSRILRFGDPLIISDFVFIYTFFCNRGDSFWTFWVNVKSDCLLRIQIRKSMSRNHWILQKLSFLDWKTSWYQLSRNKWNDDTGLYFALVKNNKSINHVDLTKLWLYGNKFLRTISYKYSINFLNILYPIM